MEITKETVLKALSTVQEPDLKKDLVTLNMIRDVEVEGKNVGFTVVLTTPACPLKELIRKSCEDAIHEIVDSEAIVKVNLTADVTSNSRPAGPVLPGVKNIIAVASGKGGVGKSTISTNLAIALQREGAKVGIMDADIFGPSVPVMLDCETAVPGMKTEDGRNLILPVERYGLKVLSIGFLSPPEKAVVWRGPMAASALRQFLSDTDWGELDYLIIDLPPGTGDIQLTLVQTVPVTGVLIVTTPQKVALADAQKGIQMFAQPQINVPILGIVENMAWFTPAELPDNKYYIFGQNGGERLAVRNKTELLGQIPLVTAVRESGDKGMPAAAEDSHPAAHYFRELAGKVARAVAVQNAENKEKKEAVV